MKILALIPARAGSKRIPGKNMRELGGKPLVSWSIEAAQAAAGITDILVSTDDPAIANLACAAGVQVPWLRPAALASDTASSIDVCLHALDWHERAAGAVDGLLLLQPTSPFRSAATIARGIELFASHGRRPVVGVAPAHSHPLWCFRVNGERMTPFVDASGLHRRSQDLAPAYVVCGAFYLAAPDDLRARRSFLEANSVPLIIERPEEGLDIDNEWDWVVAEALLADRASAGR